jgi:hypothetical protein
MILFVIFAIYLAEVHSGYVGITSGTCASNGYDDIMDLAECKTAAIEVGFVGENAKVPSRQSENDRPHGCRRQTFGPALWINDKPKSPTKASKVHSVVCRVFVQGPKTGCEPGYVQPKTAEECKALAEASNIRYWGGAGHRSGADPRGCIYRTPDRDIYFNTHETGSTKRGDRRTVCVREKPWDNCMMDALIQFCKTQSVRKHSPRYFDGQWRCFDGVDNTNLATQCLNAAGEWISCPALVGRKFSRNKAMLQVIQDNMYCLEEDGSISEAMQRNVLLKKQNAALQKLLQKMD